MFRYHGPARPGHHGMDGMTCSCVHLCMLPLVSSTLQVTRGGLTDP